MKFLIWLGFCVVFSFVQTTIKDFGILLGAIPTLILDLVLWIPAVALCNAWDIKRYKKKFPNNIVEDMLNIVDFYKHDFLIKKNFNIQDEGIEFFDSIKRQIAGLSNKEINKTMIQIIKSGSSPTNFVLKLLDTQSIDKVRKGNADEIIEQKGSTYIISKIYEYVNDVQLEQGTLSSIQHKNKLYDIELVCKEHS